MPARSSTQVRLLPPKPDSEPRTFPRIADTHSSLGGALLDGRSPRTLATIRIMPPIVIRTVRDLCAAHYRAYGWCENCSVHREIDLAGLVMKGKGDKRLSQLRIRHACGTTLELRICPPDVQGTRTPGRVWYG